MATVTDTSSTEGAATIMVGTGDAAIIMDGTAAAAITSTGTTAVIVIIIDEVFAASAFVPHCPDDVLMPRCEQVAPSRRGRFSRHRSEALPVEESSKGSSAQPHLDGDPDQVRMVLRAEFLLEQGCGVGHGLV